MTSRALLPGALFLAGVTSIACGASDATPTGTRPVDGGAYADPVAPGPVDGGGSSPDADAGRGYSATVLKTESFVRDGHTHPVVLARVDRPDGGRTYVQWVASDEPGPRGAVLATMPYAGIDWTGEEIDTRWAGYTLEGGLLHLDVDGDKQNQVVYEKRTSAKINDEAGIHLSNGLSTLFVFGRFYAGGSVRDDVEDMKAGSWFLAEQANVDKTRVGVFGGSWGGFESLYASAFADPRILPRVTVALYPVVDFPSWSTYAASRPEGFFRPYLHRINAGVTNQDYTGLRFDDLCAGLPEATFLLHDDHDSLVPVDQSRELAKRCGADVLFWPRTGGLPAGSPSHGPLLTELPDVTVPSAYTYATVYLHTRLVSAEHALVGVVDERAITVQLANLRQAQLRNENVAYAAPRLRELLRPRFLDLKTLGITTGKEMVTRVVNGVWSTTFTAATIEAGLASGLPAP